MKKHIVWAVGVFAKSKAAMSKAGYSHSSSAELQLHGALPTHPQLLPTTMANTIYDNWNTGMQYELPYVLNGRFKIEKLGTIVLYV
jgi:hypothetical protein